MQRSTTENTVRTSGELSQTLTYQYLVLILSVSNKVIESDEKPMSALILTKKLLKKGGGN
jgi:hypothetical protein